VSFGYGFVDYHNASDAAKAIDTYNGHQVENKRLRVAYAKQREDENLDQKNLYVSNLPVAYSEADLQDLFIKYGEVIKVHILRDLNTMQSRRAGFVMMATHKMALNAINNLDNFMPMNASEPFAVRFANENGKRSRLNSRRDHQYTMNNNNNNMIMNDMNDDNKYVSNMIKTGFFDNFQTANENFPSYGKLKHFARPNNYNNYNNQANMNSYGYMNKHDFDSLEQDNSRIVYVYGIGPHASEPDLFALFQNSGRIVRVNVIKSQASGVGKGYGFVVFETYEEACNAVRQINGYVFNNRPLQVSLKK
jgi:RNA recognition motif-containing protein